MKALDTANPCVGTPAWASPLELSSWDSPLEAVSHLIHATVPVASGADRRSHIMRIRDVCTALDNTHLLYGVSGLTRGDVKRIYAADVDSFLPSTRPIRFVDRFVGEPDDFQSLCELLSLFPLLAQLDPQSWTRRISHFWDDLGRDALDAVKKVDPFVFGVIASRQQLPMLRSTGSRQTTAAWYSSLVTRAASLLNFTVVPIPVMIVLSFGKVEDAPAMRLREEIQRVLEIVEPVGHQGRLQVAQNEEVHVNYKGQLLADIQTVESMKQLASFGVRIHSLLGIASDDRARILACLNVLVPPDQSTSSPPRV